MQENQHEGMSDLAECMKCSQHNLGINDMVESFATERIEFQSKIDQQNQRIDILQQSMKNLLQRMDKMEKGYSDVENTVEKQGDDIAANTEKLGHIDIRPDETLQKQTTDFNKNIINIMNDEPQNDLKSNCDQPMELGMHVIENIDKHWKERLSNGQKTEHVSIEIAKEEVKQHENDADFAKEKQICNDKFAQFENSIRLLTQEIANLKEFAGRITTLHSTLNQPEVAEKAWTVSYLHQEDYEKRTEIQKWNGFLENLKTSNTSDCKYLSELDDTILRYGNLVYSTEWRWRLLRLSTAMEVGQFLGNYIKIGAIVHIKNISVKVFTKLKDFNKEISNGNWFRYSYNLAIYVDDDEKFFRVALKVDSCQRVSILHWQDERKSKELPKDGRFVLVDEHYSVLGYRMLEVEF